MIRPAEDIYNDMLNKFPSTMKEASEDNSKSSVDRYMTLSGIPVVKFDAFKDAFIKNMALTGTPLSCDVLYMTAQNELFLIEFKNGKIEARKNQDIKIKIFESLLMLSEEFSRTIEFTRDNLELILVYNENANHGPKELADTGLNAIKMIVCNLAHIRMIRFGLHRFKKLYFKDVYTYSKAEFKSEFVDKYCVEDTR